MVRSIVGAMVLLVANSVSAGLLWKAGILNVVCADNHGNPISNATVKVKTSKILGWGHGGDSDYVTTKAETDSAGVAKVSFKYIIPDFEWDIVTPSHHSYRFKAQRECFGGEINDEGFYDSDSDNVESVKIVNEIKTLGEVKDVNGYTNLIGKLAAVNDWNQDDEIKRFVSFFPMRNPQPMCSYNQNLNTRLPMKNIEVSKDCDVDVEKYQPVEFDMKVGKFLPPWGSRDGRKAGEVADFKIVRYHVNTNSVDTYYGWLEFAPGCGAYKMKKTGDESFPSTYEADTNAVFVGKIPFEYHRAGGRFWEEKSILAKDEYMVLRTRVMFNDAGSITNCHYSKIVGGMWIWKDVHFNAAIFNPRANDNNLEFDVYENLADKFGGDGGVYCP